MVQTSINMGMAKAVIFISGNAHFGDILAKRIPFSEKWGASQNLYEVVSSGIGQNPRMEHYPNAARVRLRSCDTRGNRNYFNECKFPFYRDGAFHNECIVDEEDPGGRQWCFYEIGQHNIPFNMNAWVSDALILIILTYVPLYLHMLYYVGVLHS